MTLRFVPIAAAVTVVFCLAVVDLSAEVRIWTDKTGKHEIEAEFLDVQKGKARLRKPDGEVVSVPLSKLSKGDQQHLRDLARGESTVGNGSSIGPSPRNRRTFNLQQETTQGDTVTRRNFSYQTGGAKEKPNRRTWTDATGKHKIEAAFVELDGKNIRLRRSDGKVLSLPLAKLSEKDQQAAHRLANGLAPGAIAADNPFGDQAIDDEFTGAAPKREPGEFLPGDIVEVEDWGELKQGKILSVDDRALKVLFDGEDDVDHVWRSEDSLRLVRADPNAVLRGANGLPLTRPGFSNMLRVVFSGSPVASFHADSSGAANAGRLRAVGLGPKRGFFEKLTGLTISPDGRFAMLSYAGGKGVRDKIGRVQICDLQNARARQFESPDGGFSISAISPSGARIASVSAADFHDKSAVDVWAVDSRGSGGELGHVKSWKPFPDEFFKDVKDVAWLDDERLLTVGRQGIIVWQVDSAQAVFGLKLDGLSAGALSPGQKQLALVDSEYVYVLDAANGDLLQQVAVPSGRNHRALAFDPSGRLLVALGGSQLDLINLETGELFDTLYVPGGGSEVCWADEEHVLVAGRELLHVPSQMSVWKYQHTAGKTAHAAGVHWYLLSGAGNENVLLPLRLPHAAVKKISDRELVLRAGDAVSLELELVNSFGGGNSILDDVRDKLAKDLETAGYVVAEDAPNVLVARTDSGENREMEYRDFHAHRGPVDKISAVERIYTLELQVDGKTVWTRRQVQGPPHFLQLEKNENVNQAVQRVMKPSAGYFGRGIPGRILPTEQAEARTSEITASGIR